MSEVDQGRRVAAAVSAVCLIGALALSGCTNVKRAIGLDPTMPDEFEVEARAPLTIPPDFDLRPPKPGAPRPQEVSADRLARQDLDSVGPGKPGKGGSAVDLPLVGIANAQAPNPNAQVVPGSLAGKLLDYGAGGGAVENRQTTPLKDVY